MFLLSAWAERVREEWTHHMGYPVMPNAELKRLCRVRLNLPLPELGLWTKAFTECEACQSNNFHKSFKAQKECILAGILLPPNVDRILPAWLQLHSAIVPQLKTHIPLQELTIHCLSSNCVNVYIERDGFSSTYFREFSFCDSSCDHLHLTITGVFVLGGLSGILLKKSFQFWNITRPFYI